MQQNQQHENNQENLHQEIKKYVDDKKELYQSLLTYLDDSEEESFKDIIKAVNAEELLFHRQLLHLII